MALANADSSASDAEHTSECLTACCQQLCQTREATTAIDAAIEAAREKRQRSQPRTAPSTRRQRKKRKSTHSIRKEQAQELQHTIRGLQTQLDVLKQCAVGGRDGWPENVLLRRAIEEQHVLLARAQSIMSAAPRNVLSYMHPTHMAIRLGTDSTERLKTLQALKEAKLRIARRFLSERSYDLVPTAAYSTEERFESPSGDWFTTRLDVTPLRDIYGGVEAVLAALQQILFNAEIVLSEALGALTVREDASLGDDPFCHARLRTAMPQGLLVESNGVHFSELVDGEAVLATDFVDEDELYPYRPQQRVRRDTTGVLRVAVHESENENKNERVVVLTRWRCSCIRGSALAVSRQELQELHDADARMTDAMLVYLRQQLALPTSL